MFDAFPPRPEFKSFLSSKLVCTSALVAVLFCAVTGCAKPNVPGVVGTNMFHDITQVRKNMSPNEVRRVMGGDYKSQMEEGIRGMDGGNYTWVYAEGRVNFGMNGVTSVEPN